MIKELFKAKEKTSGKWMYGYYCQDDANARIISSIDIKVTADIEPQTLCRNAHCSDVNDNTIFESDIIKYYKVESSGNGWDEPSESWITEVYDIVAYHYGVLCLEHCWELSAFNVSKEMRCEDTDNIMIHDAYNLDEYPNIKSDADLFVAEVIGNKYDNPELLELIEE